MIVVFNNDNDGLKMKSVVMLDMFSESVNCWKVKLRILCVHMLWSHICYGLAYMLWSHICYGLIYVMISESVK